MNAQLDPLPSGIKLLAPEKSERLTKLYGDSPHILPRTMEHCITCRGAKTFKGWSKADPNTAVVYDCNCRDQFLMHRYFLYHGIPRMYQLFTWDDVSADPAATQKVIDYIERKDQFADSGTGMFLHGKPGTGKTMFGTLVLKKFLADGRDGFFTSFVDLIRDNMQGFDDKDLQDWFVRQIRHTPVLLIDDPGKEHQRHSENHVSFITSIMDNMLRHRTAHKLSTIITSNDSPQEFAKRYPGVESLLSEATIVIPVTGQDFRPIRQQRAERERNEGIVRPVVVG